MTAQGRVQKHHAALTPGGWAARTAARQDGRVPPRPSIDSDDDVVTDLLASTLELVAEAGGWVDPTTVLVCRDGQLSLRSDADEEATLVYVPREAMVRVDSVAWADDDEHLLVQGLPDDIGDIELQMLYVQAALHNQCGKLPWLGSSHPALSPDVSDDLTEHVRHVVPSFRSTHLTARDVLWANRCFRLPITDANPRVLVPIVDLLNHHSSGAAGQWDGAGFSVTAHRAFGSHECALDYGMGRDALELAVVYGFVDASAEIAHSAPVTVTLCDGHRLTVIGGGRTADGAWLAVESHASGTSTSVSHLTFSSNAPDLAATDLAAATGWDTTRAREAVDLVARANLDLLEPIIDTPDPGEAARTLASAADHQRSVLSATVH